MARLPAVFWIRRFIMIFAMAFSGLFLFEFLEGNSPETALWYSAGWGSVAALISSSLSTWWGYRTRCAAVFRKRDDEPAAETSEGRRNETL